MLEYDTADMHGLLGQGSVMLVQVLSCGYVEQKKVIAI